MLWIMLVLFIVGEAVAQVPFRGVCSIPNTVQNFEVGKYMEKWYEFAKYTGRGGTWSECLTAIYTLGKNGSFKIKNTQLPLGDGKQVTYQYTAAPISNSRNGEFTLTPGGTPYWVLATDYTSWTLVSSCTTSKGTSLRSVWIYTRALNPSDQVIGAAYAAAHANGFSKNDFTPMNDNGCPESS